MRGRGRYGAARGFGGRRRGRGRRHARQDHPRAAADPDGLAVAFSALAQSCRTYEEYTARMAATATADIEGVGVALHGPRKRVDRLVGALPLLR
ncbi:DUF2000 family protein [Amycolatopsis sp. cg9]|uniref:DUF2000 family protein n=1 Tax=Amycolatopsis sp. cg9 TaxID=3238801 RepID=UPI0035248138